MVEITASTYSGEIFTLQLVEKQRRFLPMKKSDWGMVNHDDKNTGHSSYYLPFLERITFWN